LARQYALIAGSEGRLFQRGTERQLSEPPVIVWLRDDLRLDDQPALAAAARSGDLRS
jgi:hypothetical protein